MGDQGTNRRARARAHAVRLLAMGAVVALGAVTGMGAAVAAPGDTSSARGAFFGGTLLSALSAQQLALLNESAASNDGTMPTIVDRDSVDVGLLNTMLFSLPGGVQVPLRVGGASVGALGSYAQAGPDASSLGAAGLVGNTGAIGVGAVPPAQQPGPMTIGLHDVLGSQLTGELADLSLQLGAVSARATDTRGGVPAGDYQIAGGKLLVTSTTVRSITSSVSSAVATLQAAASARASAAGPGLLSTLQGSLNALGLGTFPAAGNNATLTVDLSAAAQLPATLTSQDGSVTIDLASGLISVDLDRVGAGLNGRAPNTSLLDPTTLSAVSTTVVNLVTGMVTDLGTRLDTALQNTSVSLNAQLLLPKLPLVPQTGVTVSVAGTLAQLLGTGTGSPTVTVTAIGGLDVSLITPAGLLAALRPGLTTLSTGLAGDLGALTSTLQTTVISPVTTATAPALRALRGVIDLTVNNQDPAPSAGAAFRETALRLTLLQRGPIGSLATLDLATGEVGANRVGTVPVTTGLTPASGPEAGGTPVTITGSGFTGATSAEFDGVPGTNFTVVDDTTITVVTPYHAAGTVPVTVRNLTGPSTPALDYTYVRGLAATAIAPADGPTTGGTLVHLTGACLDTVTAVAFDGVPGTGIVHVDDSELTVVTPAHAAGNVAVTVTGGSLACGTVTAPVPGGFTYLTPAPTAPLIDALAPATGPETGNQVVTVTGQNFTGATAVTIDGVPVTFTVDSDTSLHFSTPPHAPGPVPVAVSGPGGTSPGAVYAYEPVIRVTGIAPASGPTAGGTPVTITGSCFTGATAASVGGTALAGFTVVDDRTITGTTPAGTAGPADVTVTGSSACSGSATAAGLYAYIAPAPPVIDSIAPSSGPTAGGTPVTITGTGLTGTTDVTFGGVPATAVQVVSDTEVTAVTGARTAGTVDVVLTRGDQTAALEDGFVYLAPPAPLLTSITPPSGTTAGGDTVVITGSGFTGANGVTFDGLAATGVSVDSDTQITAVTPAHVAGAVDVVVQNPIAQGDGTLANGFTYVLPPVPSATSLLPASGTELGGTVVTISGSNLAASTGVTFDGIPGSAVSATATTVTVTTPPHAPGLVDVVVQNPGGAVTLGGAYTFTPAGGPTVTQLDPITGPTAGGTPVTITGTDLDQVTSVDFGGGTVPVEPGGSATAITVVTPAHAAGSVDVTLNTAGAPVVLSGAFAFADPVPLAVGAASPSSGPETGGTVVTLPGTGLGAVTGVTFDGIPAAGWTLVDATHIEATSPAHAPGAVQIAVISPTASATTAFEYLPAAPVIAGVAPATGSTAGGQTVTITGSGLAGTTAVDLGGVVVTPVASTATSVTVVTPPHAAGTVDVTVTAPGGTATATNAYTFAAPPPAPVVGSVAPVSGPASGGQTVVITGQFFDGATAVSIGGPVASYTVDSPTRITAVTAPGAPGTVAVTVDGPTGSGTLAGAYTYLAAPVISGVSPASGTTAGGTTVTITGSNLDLVTSVTFDGLAAAVSSTTPTALQVSTPAHPAGPVDVAVSGTGGSATSVGAFTYVPPPTLTGIAPVSGPVGGSTLVTLTGTGFSGTPDVTFDGIAATAVTVVSATEITALTPAHAAGAVDVRIAQPGGSSVLSAAFTYVGTAAPTVTGVAPANGSVAGGTVVTITGTGFSGATGVEFGGVAATGVTVLSPTQITAVTPPHAAGVVDVVVQHPNGDATAAGAFTFDPLAPSITTVAPDHGPQEGGTTVTISGPGLGAATGVDFGGIPGTGLTSTGPDSITVVTPAGAPGPVAVVVQLPGGPVSSDPGFTYDATPMPAVDSLDPTWDWEVGGAVVTLHGAGIGSATAVDFGGVLGTGLTRLDADTVRVVAPAHSGGVVDVTVTTPRGPVVRLAAFRYLAVGAPAPAVTGMSPYAGPSAGGTVVTITGTGLLATTGVTFGGVAGTGLQVIDDTTIRIVTPPHAAGPADVVVATAAGGSSPVSFLFTDGASTGGGSGPLPVTPGGGLATTGTDASGGIFGALAMIVVGAAAVTAGAARRRLG